MNRLAIVCTTLLAAGLLMCLPVRGDDQGKPAAQAAPPKPRSSPPAAQSSSTGSPAAKAAPPGTASGPVRPQPVSFLHDIAPIFVENCIGCHNTKKAESKYVMTSFAQLVRGGAQSEGAAVVPGKPDESFLIESISPDAVTRMPYKLDPLPPEKIALITRWVEEGGHYDGASPSEDWPIAMRKAEKITIPQVYPATLPITALAFTPDGRSIISAGFHEINIWDTATGELKRRVPGLAERIYRIAYSPDGKWLAVACGDPGVYGIARLFKVQNDGRLDMIRDLAETQDVVFAVAFSPDSRRLAVAAADRTVRVIEIETGKSLFQLEDHADWVVDVAFSPDGKRLASASRDKTAKIFDLEKRESLVTYPGHNQPVFSVAFLPDGKAVASGGEDNRIRIWNPDADGKQIREIGGFAGAVFTHRFTPDGKNLLAAGADRSVHVYTDKGSSVRKLEGHKDWIYCLAVTSDSRTIASGAWDGEIRLWNAADGKLIRSWIAAPGYKPPGPQAAR